MRQVIWEVASFGSANPRENGGRSGLFPSPERRQNDGFKGFRHDHNISGRPSNTRPTNGVFGVKNREFIVVRKWHFFYNFCA
jgi:hypothetical protein